MDVIYMYQLCVLTLFCPCKPVKIKSFSLYVTFEAVSKVDHSANVNQTDRIVFKTS